MESGDRELVNGGSSNQREENKLWFGSSTQETYLPFTGDVENKINSFDQFDFLKNCHEKIKGY